MKAVALCVLCSVLGLALVGGGAFADPVQWRTADGGNDHWYELKTTAASISWTNAHNASFRVGGYLATVTSAGENEFIFTHLMSGTAIPGAYGPWLGASQTAGSAEPSGGWGWYDTHEAPVYGNWASGEPNNGGGSWQENRLGFNGPTHANWLDLPDDGANDVFAWIVEYETDPAAWRGAMTDLGTLGGSYSSAEDVNARGQVVGSSTTSTGAQHAFLYSNGQMTDLGTLGGAFSSAASINANGQVAGYSSTSNGYAHAFLYADGRMTDLGTFDGGAWSYATGINDRGQVVGYASTSNGYAHAFLYADGRMTDLGTLDGGDYSYPTGINERGQVVGYSYTRTGTFRAFLYSDGQMTDLGTLDGGGYSYPTGINSSGQVVGYASTSSYAHAFLYAGDQMTDLGTFGAWSSSATDINASGQVVGYVYSGATIAFLYADGQMTALWTLGWESSHATGINDSGQVYGDFAIASGSAYRPSAVHAFLYSDGLSVDLGTLGGRDSFSNAMNSSGQVVGYSYTSAGAVHAFVTASTDTTAPTIQCPADITAEATSAAGAAVTFSATATDVVTASPTLTYSPESGSTFALGTTTVTCTATDTAGNAGSCSFTVTVVDTTVPTLTVPSDVTVEATSLTGQAVAIGTATASDLFGATVSSDAPALFVYGTTIVTWTATDGHGLMTTGTQRVTVRDTKAPAVTCPAPITIEATGADTAVFWTASASDLVDGTVNVTCAPASGSSFGLGTTTVACTAMDGHGNSASSSFTVTVLDTTAPALTCPAALAVEATGASTAVTWAAGAVDLVDGAVIVTCSPASGSSFGLGTTTVRCTATDAHGNSASSTFAVTVIDATPPAVACPSGITLEATGAATLVIWSATASDLVDGVVAVSSAPASGSTFPVGATTVHCTATDLHGNIGSSSFTVTITDTTAPTLACPADITLSATSSAGAPVTFSATATDLVDAAPAVSYSPKSGSTFAIGTTSVTCTATDASGNSSSCTFSVTVESGAAQSESLADELAALPPSGSSTTDAAIQSAMDDLQASADPTLWIDATHVTSTGGKTVFSDHRSAIKTLSKLSNPDPVVTEVILGVVALDQLLAQTAVLDATARGGDAKAIAKAQKDLDAGRAAEVAGDYAKAANDYKSAWKTAIGA